MTAKGSEEKINLSTPGMYVLVLAALHVSCGGQQGQVGSLDLDPFQNGANWLQ